MPEFSGPALGAELDRLERRWIESGFRLTAAELLG
jgi:poly(A) polymerase